MCRFFRYALLQLPPWLRTRSETSIYGIQPVCFTFLGDTLNKPKGNPKIAPCFPSGLPYRHCSLGTDHAAPIRPLPSSPAKFIVTVQISLLTVRAGVFNPRLHSLRLTVLRTAQPSNRIASEGRLAERHRAGYLKCPHTRQNLSSEIWTATIHFSCRSRSAVPCFALEKQGNFVRRTSVFQSGTFLYPTLARGLLNQSEQNPRICSVAFRQHIARFLLCG